MTVTLLPAWFDTATKQDLITGVGCPFCRHEGPYWVEACKLHQIISDLSEDKMIANQIADNAHEILDAIRDKLGVDPEDDLLSRIDDLIADQPA